METDVSLASSQEPPLLPILSQINLIYTFLPCLRKTYFNITLPSDSSSS
jgi:hypothetical protein